MRRLVNLMLGCAFTLVLISPLGAAERQGKKGTKAKAGDRQRQHGKLEEIVVSGTIEKKETSRKDRKTGEKKRMDRYVLIDAKGNTVFLPKLAKDPDIDLADNVGKQVTVKGQGRVTVRKRQGKEKKVITIRKISSIEAAAEKPAVEGE